MNIEQLETELQALVENLNESTFVYDLLLAYGQPKSSITRLQKGDYNLSKMQGEILWKKRLCFRQDRYADLYHLIDSLKNDPAIMKQQPRFIIVTDFEKLLAVDTKTNDTLDRPLAELAKHYDFFLPWAGMEKTQLQSENSADIKAAERMGRLYEIILHENPPEDDPERAEKSRHALNLFLARLLFCFFAEDTGIFADGHFTNAIASHTQEDGSDLQAYLQRLFTVLNIEDRSTYPQFLQGFPYVNGGLFADESPVPTFGPRARKIIIECGSLNWQAINPDIFGSMIQAVVHDEQRGSMGMHYTSVVNIMKVIEPLFLNDLYAELEKAGNNSKRLNALLARIYRLRIFDPACGSGNFLIIAYKELCKLEIEIFKRLQGHQLAFRFNSQLSLSQFYGIELDDFAHETAKLSLWLAQHQMNMAFKQVFGDARPTLPLQDGGNIVCGNATRLDWEEVCPKEEGAEIYILGNPPYYGAKRQSKSQKADMRYIFQGSKTYKNLDYIACWFFLGSRYIEDSNHKFAFVATNSIVQGDQVSLLWPYIIERRQEVFFAHTSFKWGNNAKRNAGVSCIIVGIADSFSGTKLIYTGTRKTIVRNISPYLTDGGNLIVFKRRKRISDLPEMVYGNMPLEGNHLKLNGLERDRLLVQNQSSERFIRPLIGGSEFLNGKNRWCLWIEDEELEDALKIELIAERIDNVKRFRENGGDVARTLVDRSHQFRYRHEAQNSFILIPCTSSENRDYLPIGFLSPLHKGQKRRKFELRPERKFVSFA